ncbi:MAG TPA: heavy metal-binding domain-containing protein [Solirubrobacteraceae bacterium]|nr:heavy metal-binding domain-containing protein [Solirubrobacteraceae bacterium]
MCEDLVVSPFGRHRPPAPTEEERRAAEVDLERIRQGGIPLGAEERLKRVATASTPFFTSDLTAKEYALAQASGLQPVAQVMGSSVVQRGWLGTQGAFYVTGEITGLSEPWNMARSRAFDRLRQEAELADADGVIGIEMTTGSLGEAGNVELVVFGTAVRDSTLPPHPGGRLGMCTLSGQDVDKLRRIGADVRGVVGHTTVLSVQLGMNSSWVMNAGGMFGGGARMNAEITEISQGVYDARDRAMAEVRRQASAVGANDLVISTLEHTIDHHEYEQGGYRYHYFHVTMNVLGTAIRLGAREPHPAPLSGPVMSINLGA